MKFTITLSNSCRHLPKIHSQCLEYQFSTQFRCFHQCFNQLSARCSQRRPLQRLYSTANTSWSTESGKQEPNIQKPSSHIKAPQIKRFWKSVQLVEQQDGYRIALDHKHIKTPNGASIVIPKHEKLLATLVAAEWDGQDKALKSYSLPLTSLVSRAIDDFRDPSSRSPIISKLINYLHTDTICYRNEFPSSLVSSQEKHWTPLVQWCEQRFGVQIKTTYGIMGQKQSDATVEKLREVVESMDEFTLAAFERSTYTTKSFIISLALQYRHLTAQQACHAARIEVLDQIDKWGEVEDSHDVDKEDMLRIVGSCSVVRGRGHGKLFDGFEEENRI